MFKIFSKYSIKKYNFFLVFLTITISVIGILLIGSAKSQLMERQIQGLVLSSFCVILPAPPKSEQSKVQEDSSCSRLIW